ncbi:MAG: hypothetical protein ACI8XC_000220 [Gammaproteobacteria bacterium]|jgi:hypothetical protein
MEYSHHLGAEKCLAKKQYNSFEFYTLKFYAQLELSVLAGHKILFNR